MHAVSQPELSRAAKRRRLELLGRRCHFQTNNACKNECETH